MATKNVCRICGCPDYCRRVILNIKLGINVTERPEGDLDWNQVSSNLGHMTIDVCENCGVMVEHWETWAVPKPHKNIPGGDKKLTIGKGKKVIPFKERR